MKIENPSKLIDSSLSSESISFSLKHNAKMFSVLSDNLYTDKIGSIVRELASNAIDSHKEANNLNPFDIFLPNELSSNFTISDYGMGLSKKELTTLYTQYGGSTKNDSNELIGGFGLGSKSPFAYTKSFQIISYHNNIKYIGMAFLNEEGIPHFNILNEEETNKRNGVSVSFHVKKEDFEDFKVAIDKQLSFIKHPFNVDGELVDNSVKYDDNGHLKQFNFFLKTDKPHSIISNILSVKAQNEIGCSIFELDSNFRVNSYTERSNNISVYVMVEGIRYSLGFSELHEIIKDERVLLFLKSFMESSFIMPFMNRLVIGLYCNIGDVDLLCSREKLALSQKTVSKLQDFLKKIYERIMEELEELYLKDAYLYKLYILDRLYYKCNTPAIQHNTIHVLDKFILLLDDDKKYLFDHKKCMMKYTKNLIITLTTGNNKRRYTKYNTPHHKNDTTKQLNLIDFLPYAGYNIDIEVPHVGHVEYEKYIPKIYLNDIGENFNNDNLKLYFKYGDIIIKPRSKKGISLLDNTESDIKSLLHDLGNPVLYKLSEEFPNIVVNKTPKISIKYSMYIHTDSYNYWKMYYDDEKIKNKKVVYIISNQNTSVDRNNKLFNRIFEITSDRNIFNYNSIIDNDYVLISIFKSNVNGLLKVYKNAITFDEYIERHSVDIIRDKVNNDKVNDILNFSYKIKQLEKNNLNIKTLINNIRVSIINEKYDILPLLDSIKNDEIRDMCIMIRESLQKEIKNNISRDRYLLNLFDIYDSTIKRRMELIDDSIKKFFVRYDYISYILFPSVYIHTDTDKDKEKEEFKKSIEVINKLY